MERLESQSARRDSRSFRVMLFVGIVGLILAGAQVWASLKPTRVIVEFQSPTQPIPDTPDVQPPATSGAYPETGTGSPAD